MPQPPPPISLANLVAIFTTQLTVSIHTILAARGIYPATTFIKARAYNYPIMQSRHPAVCDWINDAVKAVHAELLKGTVARVALAIFEAHHDVDADAVEDEDEDLRTGEMPEMQFDINGSPMSSSPSKRPPKSTASNAGASQDEAIRVLERYVWDVSRWPQMPKSELHTPFSHASPAASPDAAPDPQAASEVPLSDDQQRDETRQNFRAAMSRAHSDLHEQFRGLLARLSTISARMAPLRRPEACTYTLCIELREESEPPVGHPQPWIPSETPLQRRIVHARDGEDGPGEREREGGRVIDRGTELGGTRTTPVRSVDAGEMVFEMWIEEGRAKVAADAADPST